MRRVLKVAVVIAAVIVAWLYQNAEASHYFVNIDLYHPTGNYTYKAQLNCGWHDICDGAYPDSSSKGLDWVWQSNVSYEVRLRLFIVAGFSSQTKVGTVSTSNAPSGCYRIWADVFRTDGNYVGTVINQHSLVSSNKTYSIYGRDQGIYSDASIGNMVWPDNCLSSGYHTMQWYYAGPYTWSWSKNTSIPTEGSCVLCGMLYSVWNTREYGFSYYGP